ncbi:MMPL family transporter [Amycolatopsis methanolica]|uniref:RND superfamily protein-like exporter n=1 Tax=Amycolatopsis methanolica 239 TaxID=1068978 RepID=A0A076MQZ8_AMYME|nr:MMPL family transporter [Amycolatopsis methanolica]AIJ23308.1 RND superfamily protein-like exporter [Amycolatopsis methanolica 239]
MRRVARQLVASVLVAVVVTTVAAGLLRVRLDTSVESFLPREDPVVAAIEDKARSFGGDPIVAVLESELPTKLLTDGDSLPKLLALEGRLAKLPDVAAVYGPATVLNQIAASAQGLLAQIAGRRDALRNEAEQRARDEGKPARAVTEAGQAALREFDLRYGSLLVQGLPAGLPTLRNPQFVNNVVYDDQQHPRPQWQFVVPGASAVALLVRPREGLDQEGTQQLVAAVRAAVADAGLPTRKQTVTGAPVITASLADEVRGELPLLGALALVVCAAGLLAGRWLGRPLVRLWPLLVAVAGTAVVLSGFGWFGQPLSLGVLAFLPILLGLGCGYPLYLAQRPVNRRRIVVTGLSSAAAAAALVLSPLPFVAQLGVALAAGIVVTLALALLVHRRVSVLQPASRWTPPSLSRRTRIGVLAGAVVIAGLGAAALPGMRVEAQPEKLAHGLPAVADARYVEQLLGSSGEIGIVVHGDVRSPEGLAWLAQLQRTLVVAHGDRLRPVLTLPDLLAFLGEQPTAGQITAALQLLPPYLTSAVIRADGQESVMVFGTRLDDVAEQARLVHEIEAGLPAPPPDLRAEPAGLPLAAVRGYELVSADRYLANLAGVVATGVVLLIGLRRRADAGRAVLAALLSTGWGLAALWVLGGTLSPLTVALGSLATVTACEFTVLLADAWRARRPWLRRAVGLTCLLAAAGYLVLLVSQVALLRQFGGLLAATVGLSLLAGATVVAVLPPAPVPVPVPSPRPRTSAAPAVATSKAEVNR